MDPYAQIAERIDPGSRVARRWALEGGVSASVEALELIMADGTTRKVVVRAHGDAAYKPLQADVTSREFALLTALHGAGLPVPMPTFVDTSTSVLPMPFLVMAFVDGTTQIEPPSLSSALGQMASFLARLHTLELDRVDLPSLDPREDPAAGCLETPPDPSEGDAVRAALMALQSGERRNTPALLHGDFWPGNILWQNARLVAVIDWEDAALGDPLSDLASCRLELLWKFGPPAMEEFTARYLSEVLLDVGELPLWELYVSSAALASMPNWGLDRDIEAGMRDKAVVFRDRAGRRLLAEMG